MLIVSMVLAVLYLVLSLSFGYCAYKNEGNNRGQMLWLLADMAFGAVILFVSAFSQSVRLLVAGAVCPIGVLFVITNLFALFTVKSCTLDMSAKCIGYKLFGKSFGGDCYPRFEYTYNEDKYEADSLLKYGIKEGKSKYSVGSEYLIFIDPNDPRKCVCDKGRMTVNCVAGIIVFGVVAVFGAAVLIL